MRPVDRGLSPQTQDYGDYRDAVGPLVGRLGPYCSYCERRIATGLAVEHIQPKAPHRYPHLEGKWDNYLLACVNCNSTKQDKDVTPLAVYLPDRDNTQAAFVYLADGSVQPANRNDDTAKESLALTGLDRKVRQTFDANGQLVAADRIEQRMECWLKAQRALQRYRRDRGNTDLIETIVELAQSEGFFSVWMTVFANESGMQSRFRQAFPGTDTQSFVSLVDSTLVSPRPSNGLPGAGKI